MRILDLQNGATIVSFTDQSPQVYPDSLIWLPDNRLIALRDGRILIYDPTTRQTTSPNLDLDEQLTQISKRTPR